MARATTASAGRQGADSGSSDFDQVRVALARPEFYPHSPPSVEVRETHISWLFLSGDRAYKLKKGLAGCVPREMCREELRLSRRLAPDIECIAPGSVLADRGRARHADLSRVSDADLAVVLRERSSWEALNEVSAAAHVTLRTDRDLRDTLADLLALLDRRLDAAVRPT